MKSSPRINLPFRTKHLSSYLVSWQASLQDEFIAQISRREDCFLEKSKNKPMGILIIETESQEEEENLLKGIKEIPSLESLVLVHAEFNSAPSQGDKHDIPQ